MWVVHSVVELVEEGGVFFGAGGFGEAKGFDALDEDFGGIGLGFEDLDDLGDEVFERHGARVGGLRGAHQFSLNVGWGDLDDLDVGGFELVAEGLAPGVDGCFGGAVGGSDGHWGEGEAGADGEDGCAGLLLELRKQRGGETDGAEEVGGDGGFGVGEVGAEEVFGAHDAGIVDDSIEGGVGCDEFGGGALDVGGIFDVELDGGHAGIGGGGFVERLLAAASDDDFVAEGVEGFGEGAADAGASSGDEDGVAGRVHAVLLYGR